MKKEINLIFFILTTCTGHYAEAQKEITTIDLLSGGIYDMQSFISNDTIVVSYREQKNRVLQRILPDGSHEMIYTGDILNSRLCGYEVNQGDQYFYFIESHKGKKFSLNALHFDRREKKRENVKGQILIEYPIIDVINDHGVIIVTYDSNTNSIKLISVSKCKITNEEIISLSKNSKPKKSGDFDVNQPSYTGWFYQARNHSQIYIDKDFVRVAEDDIYNRNITVHTFNRLTRSTSTKSFYGKFGNKIKSVLTDSLLFSLATSKEKFTVSVFNLTNGTLVTQREIAKERIAPDQVVYFDEGREQKKSMIETLEHTMSTSLYAEAAILAHKISPGNYSITWGTYYDERDARTILAPDPVSMLFGTASLAGRLLSDGPSISRYLYGTYENKAIDLMSRGNVIFKTLDDYEIGSEKKDLRFFNYLVNSSSMAIGFVEDAQSMKLRVIKFTI